jgi:hypothetical protein
MIKQKQMIKELETKFNLNAVSSFEFDATLIDGKEPQGIWIRDDICKKETGYYQYAEDTMNDNNILNQFLSSNGWYAQPHDSETIMLYPI